MKNGPLKLLLSEARDPISYLIKEDNRKAERDMFIEGIYLAKEEENRNGRIYTGEEMDNEVARYTKMMIDQKRSLGELNHPTSAESNPARGCHII